MNNKKLFKGALVLFASILMAVSCSNNSTGSGNDGNGSNGGNTGPQAPAEDTREALEIFPASPDKLSVAKSTTQKITASSQTFDRQDNSATTKTDFKFVGADAENIKIGAEATGNKVKAEIISILGLPNSTTVGSSFTTDVELAGAFANNVITLGGDNAGGFTLTGTKALDTALQGKSFQLNTSKGGVVVTIRFTDLSGTKKPVEIPVYLALKGA